MLDIRNLEVLYEDAILALRGVSLTVPEGAIVCLLGANGAGKTTLMRAVGGLLRDRDAEITKGEIWFKGERVDAWDPSKIVRAGVGQVPETRRIFVDLTVEDNLRVGAFSRPDSAANKRAKERVYDLFPVLADRRRLSAGHLSGGEQQMLAIGRALMSEPSLLLMDEPSLGLAPKIVSQVRDVILEINSQGTAILLVEQNARMALSIAKHGYVMETGRIVMDKPAAELVRDDDVREFYLGMGEGGSRRDFASVKHYRRRKRWLS